MQTLSSIGNTLGSAVGKVAGGVADLVPIARGYTPSPQESLAAIQQVSSEFEHVYTSINKFNSSVSEGAEQISVHTVTLKKKFQELKTVMQSGAVSTEAAAKNAEIVRIQEKIRSLKAQGKKADEFERKLAEVNEQFNSLMNPESGQAQKSATCKNIVNIVDNLGQIVFKTLSDEFVVRDSIKAYLIATIKAKKLALGPNPKPKAPKKQNDEKKENEETQEKSTLERMANGLLKNAGVFLELANQMGVEFPKEYQGDVKPTENVRPQDAGAIAASLAQIDTQVRHLNQSARNTDKIDALIVDELLPVVDEISAAMKRIVDVSTKLQKAVQQAISESRAVVHVAEYETNPAGFKIPPIRSTDEAILKLKSLIKVLHEYLIPSLIATPLVYLQDKSWGLKSHAEFRTARRKELNDLLPHVTANMPLDALRECVGEFIQAFILVLHVKIPAMQEVFPDDSTILTRVKWGPERAAMRTELEAENEKLKNSKTKNSPPAICLVVQNLVRLMMRFLTYKPIARPHVFKNDTEWTLVSESKLRFQLRKQLLIST